MNNKNKLLRILGDGDNNTNMFAAVLLRDFQDEHYTCDEQYKDFAERPQWEEHIVKKISPSWGHHKTCSEITLNVRLIPDD